MTNKKDRVANGVTNVDSVRSKRPVTHMVGASCTSRHAVVYKVAKIISLNFFKFSSHIAP